jgi:hypothetical protein
MFNASTQAKLGKSKAFQKRQQSCRKQNIAKALIRLRFYRLRKKSH